MFGSRISKQVDEFYRKTSFSPRATKFQFVIFTFDAESFFNSRHRIARLSLLSGDVPCSRRVFPITFLSSTALAPRVTDEAQGSCVPFAGVNWLKGSIRCGRGSLSREIWFLPACLSADTLVPFHAFHYVSPRAGYVVTVSDNITCVFSSAFPIFSLADCAETATHSWEMSGNLRFNELEKRNWLMRLANRFQSN